MYIGIHVKHVLLWSDFNEPWIVSKNQISWKSIQREPSCSMRTYRQTDGQTWQKSIVAIRNFANAP